MNRRLFLKCAYTASASSLFATAVGCRFAGARQGIGDCGSGKNQTSRRARKLLIVQFGGGTRSSESIGDPKHAFIPHLWNDLVPRGALFTNMRVEGRVVHSNSTGSMMTGHWEWDDLDWTKPVAHPTIFEVYRRAASASDLKAWAFVYASILAKAGESSAAGYGARFAANVAMPPTIPRAAAEEMDRLMAEAAAVGTEEAGRNAARSCAALARSASRISLDGLRSNAARAFMEKQFSDWKSGSGSTSHDAFLADCAIACMKTHAPDVIAVCLGEIDCAHYGSWSRYTDAIARTDALTWKLWEAAQSLQAYRDQTLILILPDHGRELETSAGLGYVHHSDFYTNTGADEGCRRTWMLALGPGVSAARVIEDPIPITTVAASALEALGLAPPAGAAPSVWSRMNQ
ncbi:MAG: hypothetical protein NTX50_13915 [Candidatus Sumerlaeota bacterium]|nr:hypothetical protein [Candidatus Sumerlaeota bacterium]